MIKMTLSIFRVWCIVMSFFTSGKDKLLCLDFWYQGNEGTDIFRPHHLPLDELYSYTFRNQHYVLLNLAKVNVRRITLNVEIWI